MPYSLMALPAWLNVLSYIIYLMVISVRPNKRVLTFTSFKDVGS